MAFAAILLLLVQAAIGMVVKPVRGDPRPPSRSAPFRLLGRIVPQRHLGDHSRAVALAVHAVLGLALAFIMIGTAINALRLGGRTIALWSSIAALLVIGAGFNGASFLDFNHNTSSLVMALLAFAALACYSVVMFLLAGAPHGHE